MSPDFAALRLDAERMEKRIADLERMLAAEKERAEYALRNLNKSRRW